MGGPTGRMLAFDVSSGAGVWTQVSLGIEGMCACRDGGHMQVMRWRSQDKAVAECDQLGVGAPAGWMLAADVSNGAGAWTKVSVMIWGM